MPASIVAFEMAHGNVGLTMMTDNDVGDAHKDYGKSNDSDDTWGKRRRQKGWNWRKRTVVAEMRVC